IRLAVPAAGPSTNLMAWEQRAAQSEEVLKWFVRLKTVETDISEAMLQAGAALRRERGFDIPVRSVVSLLDRQPLPTDSQDITHISFVFNQIKDREAQIAILQEAHR